MPRIPGELLNSVIYLYSTPKAAQAGDDSGGSGFLVAVNSEKIPQRRYIYAATNKHVIQGSHRFLRTNDRQGGMVIVPKALNWEFHHRHDDLAVALLHQVGEENFCCVPSDLLLSREKVNELDIGVGDDVFMLGRFVSHEGKQQNMPTARFGRVSMMPLEPIRTSSGFQQECYLIDCHSIGGFSGSPVFVTIHPWRRADGTINGDDPWVPYLLGVNCGTMIADLDLLDRGRPTKADLLTDQHRPVRGKVNTGLMTVIPSWKLTELLLEHPGVKAERDKLDQQSS